jgi:hypothetical protein
MCQGSEFYLLGAACACWIDSWRSSHSLPAGIWGHAITYCSAGAQFPC